MYARAEGVERFSMSFFDGFSSMRALTYTPSIPMILELLKDFDYQEFECIFGHNGILNRDAADILAFQSVVDENLNKGFVGVNGLGALLETVRSRARHRDQSGRSEREANLRRAHAHRGNPHIEGGRI